MNFSPLDVVAYRELLQHVLVDAPEKAESFIRGHNGAQRWFDDLHDTWDQSKDLLTGPITASTSEEVSGIRLLSLYNNVYNLKPQKYTKLFRHVVSLTPLSVGEKQPKWNHASHPGLSSWCDEELDQGQRDNMLDSFMRGFPAARGKQVYHALLSSTDVSGRVVFDYRNWKVVNSATSYVKSLVSHPEQLPLDKLKALAAALNDLDEVISNLGEEHEVVLHHPSGMSVVVAKVYDQPAKQVVVTPEKKPKTERPADTRSGNVVSLYQSFGRLVLTPIGVSYTVPDFKSNSKYVLEFRVSNDAQIDGPDGILTRTNLLMVSSMGYSIESKTATSSVYIDRFNDGSFIRVILDVQPSTSGKPSSLRFETR